MLFQPGKIDSHIEVEHGNNLIVLTPERQIGRAIPFPRDIDLLRTQDNGIGNLGVGQRRPFDYRWHIQDRRLSDHQAYLLRFRHLDQMMVVINCHRSDGQHHGPCNDEGNYASTTGTDFLRCHIH